jgi:hypothetical protein
MFFFTDRLPRNYVRMMLGSGDDYFIAFTQISFSERMGDKIDGFGGAFCKNDLVGMPSIEISPDVISGIFEGIGRFLAQKMDTPVHIAVDG